MGRKHTIHPLILGSMFVLLAACTSLRVHVDVQDNLRIEKYQRYAWEPESKELTLGGSAFENPLNVQRLRDAIDRQLEIRHLKPAINDDTPDCYVRLSVGVRQQLEGDGVSPLQLGVGFGSWSPGFGSSVMFFNDFRYPYREGRITVDFFDAVTRKPIWHVTVEQDLSYLTGENAQQRINEVVLAMFAKFPTGTTH